MKLIIAVVHSSDKPRVTNALVSAGFPFTKLGSTGGFLREGSTTLLIGVEEADAPKVMDILKQQCCKTERLIPVGPDPDAAVGRGAFSPEPITEEVGGGIAWLLDVEHVERF